MAPGGETRLAPDALSEIDPAASFRVEIAAHLEDARLVLLDEQEAMVPARGTSEIGPVTRFTLVPDPPLQPGTPYVLRIDGAVVREIHDPSGRVYAPKIFLLKTSGERPAPVVAPKKGGKKRGRR